MEPVVSGASEKGFFIEEWRTLLEHAQKAESYAQILSLCRTRKQLASRAPNPFVRRIVKVALLGGATTEMMEAPLALALDASGLGCNILRTDYNTMAQEMLDEGSAASKFRPEVAIIVNSPANIPAWPEPGDSLENTKRTVADVCDYWLNLCARFHDHTQAEIIINNFHPYAISPLGNLSAKLPWDTNNFIRRLNRELGDRLPSYVHVNDVESLSARYGLKVWFDERYWYHGKQPVSFTCLWPYVRNVARIVGGIFSSSAKCVVVDLDNTLWGGIVGDDGPEGLRIGEGDPVGEAFKAFQEYLLRLKQRGIMLAVCSKNDESNALAAFEKRPEMVLKREDFACFKANWRPKPENLMDIASEMNIGLDAIVFVDDNPAEREHIRLSLPDVKVLELSDDPADYPRLLDEAGWFETTSISNEDQKRAEQYRDNAKRVQLQDSSTDYASFLASLHQKAVIRPFEELQLDRITQLINKTNQFNLTTVRKSRSQVSALMQDAATHLTAYARLTDRFGDNGLISVVFGHVAGDELEIDEWLMSCRVLKRGVEYLLCNYIAERARAMGATSLHGVYRPTPKNSLVRDHYQSLGFTCLSSDEDGSVHWRLKLEDFTPFEVAIELVEEY